MIFICFLALKLNPNLSESTIPVDRYFYNRVDKLYTCNYPIRNKARLVAQGYTQVEGVDFDETFALVARLESIRLLLGVACLLKFRLYQMDVKSAFLNGYLNEE